MTDAAPTDTASPTKWWGNSVTIWGTMITTLTTVLPVIAPLLGFDVTADMVRQVGQQSVEVVQAVGGLIGTLLTIYGRARASTRLERREFRMQL